MAILSKNDNIISPIYYIKSFAKINLSLTVTGKNNNGYHLLKSLFSYIDLYDIITIQQNSNNCPSFKASGQFSSSLKNDFDSIDNNLIIKVIQKMYEKYHIPTNFDICLDKRIPVASGMGGGSSNAAAMIRFLNDFLELELSNDKLIEMGLSIGSDVPFFLQNSMAICEGVGNIVTPIDCKDELFGVIIYCGLKASTGSIFGALSKKYNQPKLDYSAKTIDYQNIIDIIKNNGNDLTDPAILFSQSIARVLYFINNTNLSVVSGMSGAGPTCFSICKNESDAEKLVFNVRSEFGNFFTKKVKFLSKIDFEKILPSLQPNYGGINLVQNYNQYNIEC